MKHTDFDFQALEQHKQDFFKNGGKVEILPSQTVENYQRQLYEKFPVNTTLDEPDFNDEPTNDNQINETLYQDTQP